MYRINLQPQRKSFVDIVKIIACFGVIIIHVHSSTIAAENIGQFFLSFCVPYFYITAIAYFIKSLRKDMFLKEIFRKMWNRIGVPFIVWSIIYASLLVIKSQITGNGHTLNIFRVFMYGESAEHMYYLPELIILQLIAISIFLLVFDIKQVVGLGVMFTATFYLVWGHTHSYFGVSALKNIITYLVIGFFIAPKINRSEISWPYLFLGMGLIILSLTGSNFNCAFLINEYVISLPLGGCGLLLLSLNIPNIRLPKSLTSLSSTTYGIYLSHVVFLEAFEYMVDKIHYSINYNLTNKVLISIFIFMCSSLFVMLTKKSSVLSPLLLGEPRDRSSGV